MTLSAERIVLGVSGGIAAYKAPDLVRRLREAGAEVRVVLTQGARAFVGPLTFQAVSHQPVHTDLLDPAAEAGMGHLELARWADRVVIAPATADCLARLAAGLADDLLTTLCLATEAPITVCPAMNHVMWRAAATQDNLATLVQRGIDVIGPEEGSLAEGESGPGRLTEPAEVVRRLIAAPAAPRTAGHAPKSGPLAGRHVLITAGPTREAIDAVRFIANRSSGRMGFALAAAAQASGARVTLIAGPSTEPTPTNVERIDVETALEMHAATLARASASDLFIAAAAVADYRVADPVTHKLKNSREQQTLALVANPDILRDVAALPNGPFTLGFAAETEALEEHARHKLTAKGLDMIAANRVGDGMGFEVADNTLHVLWPDGAVTLGPATKGQIAHDLLTIAGEQLDGAG